MTLDPLSNYPSIRNYVLKLQRSADPQHGKIAGRLENIASGRQFVFHSANELLACLAQDLAWNDSQASNPT